MCGNQIFLLLFGFPTRRLYVLRLYRFVLQGSSIAFSHGQCTLFWKIHLKLRIGAPPKGRISRAGAACDEHSLPLRTNSFYDVRFVFLKSCLGMLRISF